ncbi:MULTISPECIES: iron-containing redox enzyme family protein [unclassified Cryobacterium]|uniref:iron-containing redox enzyme family protein n=1 Tax=unclassified Cryobacterium TaxID=2649013 RepID=UPI002AB42A3A|nr:MULTISPECIES: iron-containing redox enzyme family protein [unclassified Cryobacterium]MDY7526981.1 iron-containing redox enzyme family protein [Cryobacterium sp. 10C2]MDY7557220.1 iron-containing redox enzyme family protein [Cryobacterium sp. 10C3]MEB0290370.1 iron-containing redox enzyme family protein [Cryobacterium sp. 10C2]
MLPSALARAALSARGPVSERLLAALSESTETGGSGLAGFEALAARALGRVPDILVDEDLQLTLFLLYRLHYDGVVPGDDEWEWHPALLAARVVLERGFEAALRASAPQPPIPAATRDDVARALFTLTGHEHNPGLALYVARAATGQQAVEFLVHRSVYALREADPYAWGIPRLAGRSKSALIEILAGEYGGGRVERMHSVLFADALRAAGLEGDYVASVDAVPAVTLASVNAISMFGLNRRLRGALVGHLAAFEMTSAIPSRLYSDGFQRLGFDDSVARYFDVHVEAGFAREQSACRALAGSLAEDDPEAVGDIMFGASVFLTLDDRQSAHLLGSWAGGYPSLRAERSSR